MKTRFKLLTLSLAAVIAISACAPAVAVTDAPTEAFVPALSFPTPTTALKPASTPDAANTSVPPTNEVQPVATSRGPDLEATDPATVSLASGGLQLVEFFRFT